MLRKDNSYRELTVTESLEYRSFLNLGKGPTCRDQQIIGSAAKPKVANKENSTRCETPTDLFFKRDVPIKEIKIYQDKYSTENNRFKADAIKFNQEPVKGYGIESNRYSYLDLDQRRKTQSPSPQLMTPLQSKQASQERITALQNNRKTSHQSGHNKNGPIIPTGININNATNDFNIYSKPTATSIPTSYLDMQQSQRAPQVIEKSVSNQQSTPSISPAISTSQLYYISSVVKAFKVRGPNIVKEHFIQNMQGIILAKRLKVGPPRKMIPLPQTDKKTLIFDLDETLAHCNTNSTTPGDVKLNVPFDNSEVMEASMNIRPYAQHLLQTLARHFELIVFTASHSNYANVVIDYLDPQKKWISHRFYREHCIQTEDGHFIKDLRTLSNRKLSDMLLIDNSPYSYMYQLQNGVPIIPYIDNRSDEELKHLLTYLLQFRNSKDMRESNNQAMKMGQYAEFDDPVDLLKCEFSEYYV